MRLSERERNNLRVEISKLESWGGPKRRLLGLKKQLKMAEEAAERDARKGRWKQVR